MSEEPYKRDEKGRLMPGTKPGPGRPKGKTMKEFARDFLLNMDDDAKVAFLNSLDKGVIWRMAEGNPHNSEDQNVNANVRYTITRGEDE